jgi:cysteine desulfurase
MTDSARVYFDHAATTPLDPRIEEAMEPFMKGGFGNPSTMYQEGRTARKAVEEAREAVAFLVGATASEVIFTASGTEADNQALRGTTEGPVSIITSAFEHPAILRTCDYLEERRGALIHYLPVGNDGIVDPEVLRRMITRDTRLVSVMAANNVVGTIQPIRDLAAVAHEYGALFHTDAVQAVGKMPIDVHRDGIDLLSMSAHKIYGPKGIGALIVREGVSIAPLILGGGQEKDLRSGTENVAGIVGFGKAATIARAEMKEENVRLVRLRNLLIDGVQSLAPDVYVIGHPHRRLPGHACIGMGGYEGETVKLLLGLDEQGISISTGSACSASHAGQPSYVLTAMGFDSFRACGSIRITLGRFNTEDDVEFFLAVLPDVMSSLRPIACGMGR